MSMPTSDKEISVAIIWVLIFCLFVIGTQFNFNPTNRQTGKEYSKFLIQELNTFPIMPGAVATGKEYRFHKEYAATISFEYKTDKGNDEIRSYYMELAKNKGWKYLGEDDGSHFKTLRFKSKNYEIFISREKKEDIHFFEVGLSGRSKQFYE